MLISKRALPTYGQGISHPQCAIIYRGPISIPVGQTDLNGHRNPRVDHTPHPVTERTGFTACRPFPTITVYGAPLSELRKVLLIISARIMAMFISV